MDTLLEGARRGAGGALVLRGESGIGLTSLLDHAVSGADDMQVLRVSGIGAETRIPYGALHRLLTTTLPGRAALPAQQLGALEGAFGLASRPALGTNPGTNLLLVGLGTLSLLSHSSEGRPMLCVVDDAEELDDQFAGALALAARRLGADAIAMLIARRYPHEAQDQFADLDELLVGGLAAADARALMRSALGPRLDVSTRERLVLETGGNPLAILELPRSVSLGTGSPFEAPLPLGLRLKQHFVGRLEVLSRPARELLLLAAISAGADPALFWRAADLLGLDLEPAYELEGAGLLLTQPIVAIGSSLVRSAAYGAASPEDRARVHLALAEAAEQAAAPVPAAWHRAAAALGPDESVAAALADAAEQLRQRGSATDSAVFLERAGSLTPEPAARARRLLDAARDRLASGVAGRAAALVAEVSALPLAPLERARAAMLRAQVAQSLGQGGDGASLMLRAAKEIAKHEPRLGREALLEALETAIFVGRFGSGGPVLEAARAARVVSSDDSDAPADLLLDGLALLFTEGQEPALPVLARAFRALQREPGGRWHTLGGLAALELWDDRVLETLVAADVELARTTPLSPISLSLGYPAGLDHVVAGRFTKAAERYDDTRVLADAVRDPAIAGIADAGSLLVSAWRGPPEEARMLIERCARDAMSHDLGRYYAFTRYALAVLANALGRYDEALTAAQETIEDNGLYLATFALPEAVESAARLGDEKTAAEAVERLAARTLSGTDWALGMLARSRALLDGPEAEALYAEAIERLAECRAVPQLARAHLLYGEWLRRHRRRRDAREHLRRAHGLFVAMSADVFAERTRGELEATGEHVTPRADGRSDVLTPQEARIAALAAAGDSNPEIGARLYISSRTVEYHLHKIYRKLAISSRVELVHALDAAEAVDGYPKDDAEGGQ